MKNENNKITKKRQNLEIVFNIRNKNLRLKSVIIKNEEIENQICKKWKEKTYI